MTSETLPEPEAPAYVDLRGFPYMPIDIVRLFGSEFHAHSSDSEWRAGVTLWLKSFHQVPAGSLPSDNVSLCRLAELGRKHKAWERVREWALHGWTLCSDERFYHKIVSESVNKAWKSHLILLSRINRRLEIESGEWERIRSFVYLRDDFTCRYCGVRGTKLECDHIIPLSRGGKTEPRNLATTCRCCNRSKGAKLLSEWRR